MRRIPKSSLIVKMLFLTPPSPCPQQMHTQMEGSVARGENFSSQRQLCYSRDYKAGNKQSGIWHWHENWPSSSSILRKPGPCCEVLTMPAGQRRLQSTLKSCLSSFSSSSILLQQVTCHISFSRESCPPSHRYHWRLLVFLSPPPLYSFLLVHGPLSSSFLPPPQALLAKSNKITKEWGISKQLPARSWKSLEAASFTSTDRVSLPFKAVGPRSRPVPVAWSHCVEMKVHLGSFYI